MWDELGLYVAILSSELADALPFVSGSMARNFLEGELTDRFFTLMGFLHLLGQPILLVLVIWIHVKRLSHVQVSAPRGLAIGSFVALLVFVFCGAGAKPRPGRFVESTGSAQSGLVLPERIPAAGLLHQQADLDDYLRHDFCFDDPALVATAEDPLRPLKSTWTIAMVAASVRTTVLSMRSTYRRGRMGHDGRTKS